MHQSLSTAALQPASGLQIRTLHLKFYKIHTDTLQKPCYTVRKIESTIVSRRCVM